MLFVLLGTVMLKVFSGRVLGVQDDVCNLINLLYSIVIY